MALTLDEAADRNGMHIVQITTQELRSTVVLCHRPGAAEPYSTHIASHDGSFLYWGHYFTSLQAAVNDAAVR
jgi:hypothetical protein